MSDIAETSKSRLTAVQKYELKFCKLFNLNYGLFTSIPKIS